MARSLNIRLRALLSEAGWTGAALAQTINALGGEAGVTLRFDRTSIAHWLGGMRPRDALVPELVAEAFSRRLGRTVSVAETGLAQSERTSPDPGRRELPQLGSIGGRDVYRTDALQVAGWSALVARSPVASAGTSACGRIGKAELDSASAMMRMFSDLDATIGGGYARETLSGYLGTTIAPWLRAKATAEVRRDLLIIASRLAYLCGFMWFDDECHGTAQDYYLASLGLAAEAADRLGYSAGLRGLSVQAEHLKHFEHAARLADRAADAVPSDASPRARAFLAAQQATAYAALGDRRVALAHLDRAERYVGAASDSPSQVVSYHAAAMAHSRANVLARLGDRPAAIRTLTTSIKLRPVEERRSRLITLAHLAELQLAEHRLDQACATWHEFLDEYPAVESGRARKCFATLRSVTASFPQSPAVRTLRGRVTAVGSAAG